MSWTIFLVSKAKCIIAYFSEVYHIFSEPTFNCILLFYNRLYDITTEIPTSQNDKIFILQMQLFVWGNIVLSRCLLLSVMAQYLRIYAYICFIIAWGKWSIKVYICFIIILDEVVSCKICNDVYILLTFFLRKIYIKFPFSNSSYFFLL